MTLSNIFVNAVRVSENFSGYDLYTNEWMMRGVHETIIHRVIGTDLDYLLTAPIDKSQLILQLSNHDLKLLARYSPQEY